jgi:hypothetical protein
MAAPPAPPPAQGAPQASATTARCGACGGQNPKEARFCAECGQKLST